MRLFSVPQKGFKDAKKFCEDYPLPSSNESDEPGSSNRTPLRIKDAKKAEFETFLTALELWCVL